jgi:alginate O-acetyltransferase complex protein AlgI
MPQVNNPMNQCWLFYDGACTFCMRMAQRARRRVSGLKLAPLQDGWVSALWRHEDKSTGKELDYGNSMLVRTPQGKWYSGAAGVVYLVRQTWLKPLAYFAYLPGVMVLLEKLYRRFATRRRCVTQQCQVKTASSNRWPLILVILSPLSFLMWKLDLASWQIMWVLATALFFLVKGWVSLSSPAYSKLEWKRKLAFWLLWMGMDPGCFSNGQNSRNVPLVEWLFAIGKLVLGVGLVWGVAGLVLEHSLLISAWAGAVGCLFVLHFGLFHLIALSWQKVGVNAKPIMQAPILARSLNAFWGRRWNMGYRDFSNGVVFRPLAKRLGLRTATMGAFLFSGVIHELVISLPAQSGYGLPTLYFLLQGCGVLLEKSMPGRRLGLGGGFAGWLFTLLMTLGPIRLLFHDGFMLGVIVPFLDAIGGI